MDYITVPPFYQNRICIHIQKLHLCTMHAVLDGKYDMS